jgi:hypothetical protein
LPARFGQQDSSPDTTVPDGGGRVQKSFTGCHFSEGVTLQPEIKVMDEKKMVGIETRFISMLSPDKNNLAK